MASRGVMRFCVPQAEISRKLEGTRPLSANSARRSGKGHSRAAEDETQYGFILTNTLDTARLAPRVSTVSPSHALVSIYDCKSGVWKAQSAPLYAPCMGTGRRYCGVAFLSYCGDVGAHGGQPQGTKSGLVIALFQGTHDQPTSQQDGSCWLGKLTSKTYAWQCSRPRRQSRHRHLAHRTAASTPTGPPQPSPQPFRP